MSASDRDDLHEGYGTQAGGAFPFVRAVIRRPIVESTSDLAQTLLLRGFKCAAAFGLGRPANSGPGPGRESLVVG